jgi:hypothetical protein
LTVGSALKLVFREPRPASRVGCLGFGIVMMSESGGGFGLESSSGPRGRGRRPPNAGEPRRAIDEARLRQQAIGVKLRQMFDQVVNEPIPQEFLDILRRGDEALSGADED